MMDRRIFLTTVAVLLAAPLAAGAQPVGKVARIGFLDAGAPPSSPDWKQRSVFYQALSDLGWREGHNLSVEWRWADGRMERLPDLATELVNLKVDVLLAGAFKPGRAARQATTSIPIVLVTCDPYQWIVDSLARPGGNVTGQSCMSAELSPKRLQLLKEVAPRISRVAFLYNPDPDEPGPSLALKLLLAEAPSLGIKLLPVPIRRPEEFDSALETIRREQPDALFVYPDPVTILVRARTVEFAAKQRLPGMYGFRGWWVDPGGLMSYGTTLADMQRRAARQVDKILKGAKPADLPVEQPTKFELVINLKSAKTIGLTIPSSLLMRADQLIE